MNISEYDEGVIEALIERLEKQRIPRMMDMLECVEAGDALNEYDLEYLKVAIEETNENRSLFNRHPEHQAMAVKVISIYKKILEKALQIEQQA